MFGVRPGHLADTQKIVIQFRELQTMILATREPTSGETNGISNHWQTAASIGLKSIKMELFGMVVIIGLHNHGIQKQA